MGNERRGWEIIINNEKFKEGGNMERNGKNEEKISMKKWFERMKFEVDVINNLKVNEIKKKLVEI